MEIDGLIYLLNQAGAALLQANQKIAQLSSENERLLAAKASDVNGKVTASQ